MIASAGGHRADSDTLAAVQAIGCQQIQLLQDEPTGLTAVIAIHSTALGPAGGGVRFWPYPDLGSAVLDAARLARAMTYKFAAASVDLGGGKAVIVGDPREHKTEALLRAFGRFVEELGGRYYIAEDVGVCPADLEVMYRETQYVLALPEHLGGPGDVSHHTALGAVEATRACLQRAFGTAELRGVRIALQGLGAVGSRALEMLVEQGADVVVCDIDADKVARAVDRHGVRTVPPDEILDQDVDVFAPYALGEVLNEQTLPRVRARVVAGGANNIFADRVHADELQRRGVVYAVDFIANSGGTVYDQEMVYDRLRARQGGFRHDAAERRARLIFDRLAHVFELADRRGIGYLAAAEALAEAQLAAALARRAIGLPVTAHRTA